MSRRTVGSPTPSLEVLSGRLRDARATVRVLRNGPVTSPMLVNARHCALVALENYVTALENRRLPVPPALHRELQLERDLFD